MRERSPLVSVLIALPLGVVALAVYLLGTLVDSVYPADRVAWLPWREFSLAFYIQGSRPFGWVVWAALTVAGVQAWRGRAWASALFAVTWAVLLLGLALRVRGVWWAPPPQLSALPFLDRLTVDVWAPLAPALLISVPCLLRIRLPDAVSIAIAWALLDVVLLATLWAGVMVVDGVSGRPAFGWARYSYLLPAGPGVAGLEGRPSRAAARAVLAQMDAQLRAEAPHLGEAERRGILRRIGWRYWAAIER